MDAYVGVQRAGSGGAWLGGDGKWCSCLRRECVLHKTINSSLEICINVYKMSIFPKKYVQLRVARKLCQNVNSSFEIYVNVFQLM